MPIDFDPYGELGVASNASVEDIKTAYRRAARRLHPDVNRNSAGAAAQFQDITAAHELLTDDARRREYDAQAKREADQPRLGFTFRVTTSKRTVVLLGETQVVYMLAEIFPDARANEHKSQNEARLNLTLVLDRSNSMQGIRLEKVKVAAHQIIDQMREDDVLSIVSFNDRAEVVIEATTVRERSTLKARVSMMSAFGGTEIGQGLKLGLEQNRKFLAPRLVNHIIMLTDGHTYGDQDFTLGLAREAADAGISISAMGLGQEWNDKFMDSIASATGGSTSYINSAGGVVRFLNDRVRGLANTFAERVTLSVAPDPDIKLESAFRLLPDPQPLDAESHIIPLGGLQYNRSIVTLLQFELPVDLKLGFRTIARLSVTGDIFPNDFQRFKSINDMSLEVTDTQVEDDPPQVILDALGKLTLYRMQEQAQAALERGDVGEATRRLENLATRLFELGHGELGQQAQAEAQQVAFTGDFTDKGRKRLVHQTRYLLSDSGPEENE